MDATTYSNTIGAFSFFIAITYLLTSVSIIGSSGENFTLNRLWCFVSYGIYGGVALKYKLQHRNELDSSYDAALKKATTSETMHAVLGMLLIFYTLFSSAILAELHKTLKLPQGTPLEWDKKMRVQGRGYTHVFVMDSIIGLAIAIATGLGSTYVPWNLNTCKTGGYQNPILGALPGTTEDQCRARYCIQIMAVMSCVSVLLQALWLKPVLALPRHTRAARIIFWTLFSKPSVEEPIKKNSIQKAIEKEKLELSKPPANFQPAPFTGAIISPGEPDVTLETVLLDVDIARCMSTYLHHADLVALTCTTKKLNKSLFQTYQNNGRGIWYEDNIGFMRNNSCNPDSLSECWACGHRICDDCKLQKEVSTLVRTTSHINTCFAYCTKCYVFTKTASNHKYVMRYDSSANLNASNGYEPEDTLRPAHFFRAPKKAIRFPKRLDYQHKQCKLDVTPQDGRSQSVWLCSNCNRLEVPAESPRTAWPRGPIARIKERRDEISNRRTMLVDGVNCRSCTRKITGRSWWVCLPGRHECHWIGHQPLEEKRQDKGKGKAVVQE